MASDEQERNKGTELVQCPGCLSYFAKEVDGATEQPDNSILRHVCFIGGRQVDLS
jgi:hypothetical protein